MEQLTLNFGEDLTCSQEAHPAKTSQLPGNAPAVKREVGLEARFAGSGSDWQESFAQEYCYGKTLSGRFPAMGGETSLSSSERLMKSGIAYRGEFLTANIPEWTSSQWPYRKDAGVCGLSDVLEAMSPKLQKYFLSREAL